MPSTHTAGPEQHRSTDSPAQHKVRSCHDPAPHSSACPALHSSPLPPQGYGGPQSNALQSQCPVAQHAARTMSEEHTAASLCSTARAACKQQLQHLSQQLRHCLLDGDDWGDACAQDHWVRLEGGLQVSLPVVITLGLHVPAPATSTHRRLSTVQDAAEPRQAC